MNYVKGKSYIVTGGAVGLGYAVAEHLAELGGNVVIANTNEERAKEAVEKLSKHDGKALYFTTDVTDPADATALMAFTSKEFGRIDGVVNCAGIMPVGEFDKYDVEKWLKCVDVNFKGTVNITHAAVRAMKAQGGKIGTIINFASTAARHHGPATGVYSATKVAVRQFMDALRTEYPGVIKFVTVFPGAYPGTSLKNSGHADADDKYFGNGAGFNPEAMAIAIQDTELDKPRFFGRPETIGVEVAHVLNQPEGVYIPEIVVTCSNDRT